MITTRRRYGELVDVQAPKVRLKIDRATVPEVLASILANHSVDDVSVEDPPLEEVIAELFTHAAGEPPLDLPGAERTAEQVAR